MVHEEDFTRSVETYYKELRSRKYDPITKEEEKVLIAKAQCGDKDAENRILESNLRFVFDIAKMFKGKGVGMGELLSEGNLGLIKAMDKFDTERNVRFISYAVWWIKCYMRIAIARANNSIEIPIEEQVSRRVTYTDDCDDDAQDYTMLDTAVFDDTEKVDSGSVLNKLSITLNDSEKNVLSMYFGLDGQKPKTLKEIGDDLEISGERVRQIKTNALRKMREVSLCISGCEQFF